MSAFGVILVRNFRHAGKCGPEWLRIWTLFTRWILHGTACFQLITVERYKNPDQMSITDSCQPCQMSMMFFLLRKYSIAFSRLLFSDFYYFFYCPHKPLSKYQIILKTFFSKFKWSFRQGLSAQYCLMSMTEKWKNSTDKGKIFAVLLTDLSKAFDCLRSATQARGLELY